MATSEETPLSAPPSTVSSTRPRRHRLSREPTPGASPGTLVVDAGEGSRVFLIDYCPTTLAERELQTIDDAIPYLEDETESITWVDVRGLRDLRTLERMGEIFKVHPLALEDVVNVPQRPKTEAYDAQQVVISRLVHIDKTGAITTEQLGIIFG